jgi:hypothetical protein
MWRSVNPGEDKSGKRILELLKNHFPVPIPFLGLRMSFGKTNLSHNMAIRILPVGQKFPCTVSKISHVEILDRSIEILDRILLFSA